MEIGFSVIDRSTFLFTSTISSGNNPGCFDFVSRRRAGLDPDPAAWQTDPAGDVFWPGYPRRRSASIPSQSSGTCTSAGAHSLAQSYNYLKNMYT